MYYDRLYCISWLITTAGLWFSYTSQRHWRSWAASWQKSKDISPSPYHSTLASVSGSNCISTMALVSPLWLQFPSHRSAGMTDFSPLNHTASLYYSFLVVVVVASYWCSIPFVFQHIFERFPNLNTCKVFYFPRWIMTVNLCKTTTTTITKHIKILWVTRKAKEFIVVPLFYFHQHIVRVHPFR